MKMVAKIAIVLTVLISIFMASACGGSTGQPASTNGTNGTNGTSAAAGGTSAAAGGTSAAAGGTSATAGTAQPTHKVSGSPSPGNSTTAAASTSNNRVILDPDTAILGNPISFGRILPRLFRRMQFEVMSRYKHPVAITISTNSPYFVPTDDCNRELQPGDSCAFWITFSAPKNGSYSAILTTTISGSVPVTRALTGIVGLAINPPPTQLAPTRNAPTQSASNPTPSGSTSSG
jgi:hypothetical protein